MMVIRLTIARTYKQFQTSRFGKKEEDARPADKGRKIAVWKTWGAVTGSTVTAPHVPPHGGYGWLGSSRLLFQQ